MDEKDEQIAHHRILAGQEIPTNYGRNNNSPATGGVTTSYVLEHIRCAGLNRFAVRIRSTFSS
jgi:hypothetical protein